MPYAEAASHPAEIRSWHARGAVGLALVATVSFVAAGTTHEARETWPYYMASLVVMAVAWAALRDKPQRGLLLTWPALSIVGLYGAGQVAPQAAVLCVGAIVLAFLVVGLTQPRWTSLGLWPLAAIVWWQLSHLPAGQSLVRGGLASVVWIAAAELPAWLTERLTSAQTRLTELARTDPLTGLDNRRSWQQHLGHLLDGVPTSVLLIDLDHFKRFNDAHGHLAGDDLLVRFAAVLRDAVRGEDLVARWGGEEFAVALPGVSGEEAHRVADRILASVPLGQSCSIGLTERRPGESPDTLMSRADRALYQAKDEGRNRVVAA
jgi:diguanylate cyclase (GGDEF)-like protein